MKPYGTIKQYVKLVEEKVNEFDFGFLRDIYKDAKYWRRVINKTETCIEGGGAQGVSDPSL